MKAKELRDLTVEELKKKAADTSRELMLARFAKANQQLKNPLKVRNLRRDVARIMTLMSEKSREVK